MSTMNGIQLLRSVQDSSISTFDRLSHQLIRRYVPVSTSAHPSESGENWIFIE